MRTSILTAFALAAGTWGAPEHIEKRQDYAQLISLASYAGITALPTDPAILLQLQPLASRLAAALPTAPVLSVLQTAAPKSFISNIVHDPGYAKSFESAFAAGHSPSWFNALPTSVKSYLHTYSGFGGLATAAQQLQHATAKTMAASGSGATGKTGSGATPKQTVASTTATATTTSSATVTTTSSASGTKASQPSGTAGAGGAGTKPSSTTASGGASHPTGAVAAAMFGVAGVLGLAAML